MASHRGPTINTAVQRAFKQCDRNQSGALDVKEVREALNLLGCRADTGAAATALKRYDSDRDRTLDLHEFNELVVDVALQSAEAKEAKNTSEKPLNKGDEALQRDLLRQGAGQQARVEPRRHMPAATETAPKRPTRPGERPAERPAADKGGAKREVLRDVISSSRSFPLKHGMPRPAQQLVGSTAPAKVTPSQRAANQAQFSTANPVLAPSRSKHNDAAIRRAYLLFDKSGEGGLGPRKLGRALQQLSLEVSRDYFPHMGMASSRAPSACGRGVLPSSFRMWPWRPPELLPHVAVASS
jgi:Ca2+-binding EF-hand superfamily protein